MIAVKAGYLVFINFS